MLHIDANWSFRLTDPAVKEHLLKDIMSFGPRFRLQMLRSQILAVLLGVSSDIEGFRCF